MYNMFYTVTNDLKKFSPYIQFTAEKVKIVLKILMVPKDVMLYIQM